MYDIPHLNTISIINTCVYHLNKLVTHHNISLSYYIIKFSVLISGMIARRDTRKDISFTRKNMGQSLLLFRKKIQSGGVVM